MGEWRYSSIYLTSALDGGEWSASRLCPITPGETASFTVIVQQCYIFFRRRYCHLYTHFLKDADLLAGYGMFLVSEQGTTALLDRVKSSREPTLYFPGEELVF
jgi:hypothetical protein